MPLLRKFPYQRIVQFFADLGIEARTDDDCCVCKGTDAAGIRDALLREVVAHGGTVRTGCRVVRMEPSWQVHLGTAASWRQGTYASRPVARAILVPARPGMASRCVAALA